MKRQILAFCLGALAVCALNAAAAPFLIADVPSPGSDAADTCVYTTSSGALVTGPVAVDASLGLPANNNRICKMDLSSSIVGTNNVKLRLRAGSGLWGDSTDVPFTFARPASISPPATLRLAP